MNKAIDILGTFSEQETKEHYIKVMPEKLIRLTALRALKEQLNKEEKEIQIMVEKIGVFENEYFSIYEKIKRETKVDYTDLQNAIANIVPNLNENQQDIYHELMETIKKDIEVKKPADKLKMLSQLDPNKANEIKRVVEKVSLVIKPNEETLGELIDSQINTVKNDNGLAN